MKTDAEKFGKFLRDMMDIYGFGAPLAASITDMSRQAIWRHMEGKKLPSFNSRRKYAEMFWFPIQRFEHMWREGSPQRSPEYPEKMQPLPELPPGSNNAFDVAAVLKWFRTANPDRKAMWLLQLMLQADDSIRVRALEAARAAERALADRSAVAPPTIAEKRGSRRGRNRDGSE